MRAKFFKALHRAIIINFALEILYAAYMVFFALSGTGKPAVLFGKAVEIPFEMMVVRRLYAIECWIAICGLSIYLALTEILPARKTTNTP